MSMDTHEQDCAVCLQRCHHPTKLPCGHIFCFLCVKGIALQSKKCAMCRAEIPPDYLDHPILLEKISLEHSNLNPDEEYQWYYEGRNGWWKYDERSNSELEAAFNEGKSECTLLIAGALYKIDFQNMLQVRHSDTTRRRHVRRDIATLPAKGIAGIKNIDNKPTNQEKTSNENNISITSNREQLNEVIEIASDSDDVEPDDTVEIISPHSDDAIISIVESISTLNLSGGSESPLDNFINEDT